MCGDDIIRSTADKGDAVVIQDVKDYIKEAKQQLNNKQCSREINHNPTGTNKKLIDQTTERFKKERLSKDKVTDGLKVENSRTPKFCTLPKIHKLGNPGRLVESTTNYSTSKISKYVDYHLEPSSKNNSNVCKRQTTLSIK